MPRNIVNEGRVVGYSTYEAYLKQIISEDPTAIPATEKEWLNSMISYGSSMLLQVGTDTIEGPHYRDIAFPPNTSLVAANTIFGEYFGGIGRILETATCNPASVDTAWCTEVIDYGPLIHNVDTPLPDGVVGPNINEHPIDAPITHDVDTRTTDRFSDEILDGLKEYIKIVDGIIIQPGEWDNVSIPDSKLHDPDFTTDAPSFENNQYPRLRVLLSDKIRNPFYVLLTGFTSKSIINGLTATKSTGIIHDRPHQDGAFIGPGHWPWSAKVVFTVPNSYVNFIMSNNYRRKLRPQYNPGVPSDTANLPRLVPDEPEKQYVKTNPVIDMDNSNPSDYYTRIKSGANTSMVKLQVEDVIDTGGGLAVLTTYQSDELLPSALFGTKVIEPGVISNQLLNPIDIVAPGTLKLFHGDIEAINGDIDQPIEKARALETIPQNIAAMRRSSNYTWHQLGPDGAPRASIPVAETYIQASPVPGVGATWDSFTAPIARPDIVQLKTGKQSRRMLSMEGSDGKLYNTSGMTSGTAVRGRLNVSGRGEVLTNNIRGIDDNLSWDHLLVALSNNQKIDIVGDELKTLRNNLPNIITRGYLQINGNSPTDVGSGMNNPVNGLTYNYIRGNTTIGDGSGKTTTINSNLIVQHPARLNSTLTVVGHSNVSTITSSGLTRGANITVDTNYITFGGIRLYISGSQPGILGVPPGSIGIGWG